MIRLSIFWCAVLFIATYTWKDWFRALCALILMVGILEMPDVPKTVFGIDGLNFFNVLVLNLVVAWQVARYKENLKFDLPMHVAVLALAYLAVVLIAFYRMFYDRSYMAETTSGIVREYLLNTLKWTIPGVLLYDGARTRERVRLALLSVLGIYLFLAVMVIKVMPIRAVLMSSTDLQRLALKLLVSRIGLHRVTLSMMLAGASWACLAVRGLTEDRRLRILTFFLSFGVLYAQSLTAGRAGYVTWAGVGLILCVLRWRGYLALAPVMAVVIVLLVPSVGDRLFEGFVRDPFNSEITVNDYELTAGRVIIWPLVIAKIKTGMMLGFGRVAMLRTGITAYASTVLAEDFGHPHNAYLEFILDNGIVGFLPVMAFYLVVLFHAARMFCDRRSGIFMAAGGMCAALVGALLFASMGSQSFYPIEGTVGMWCAIGIMLRVTVNRKQALATLKPASTFATPWSRPVPFGVREPAAAAASVDSLLWPEADPAFPVPQTVPLGGIRAPATAPGPPVVAINPAFAARHSTPRPASTPQATAAAAAAAKPQPTPVKPQPAASRALAPSGRFRF